MNKLKKLILLVIMSILFGNVQMGNLSYAKEFAQLPKYPTETKITPSRFVPRINTEIIYQIDDFGYENTETGISSDYRLEVYNFENKTQRLKEIAIPEIKLEKFEGGQWINNGLEVSGKMMLPSSFTNMGVENVKYKPGDTQNFKILRENIESALNREKNNWDDISGFNIYFTLLKENGDVDYWRNPNRLVNNGTANFKYDIFDDLTNNSYVTLQGQASWYTTSISGRIDKPYPINWLYFETSDIALEVVEPKTEYNPGDIVKLKVTIKNTSENLSNTRIVSGLDFGEKEIVKNPINTKGQPDITFDLPTELGTNGYIKNTINPNEELSFETEITLPDDFTEYLNDKGDKLILTPYLYTANIFRDGSGQNNYFHPEEREYNEGLELPLVKLNQIQFEPNGGKFTDGSTDIKVVEVRDGEQVLAEVVKKDGYEFDGWYKNIEFTEKYDFSTVVTENINLYAKWEYEEPTDKLKVTYDGNGNTSGTAPIDSNEYSKNDTVTVKNKDNLLKSGYTFKGWSEDKNTTKATYLTGDTFKITKNTTLYAVWEKDDSDGGTWWIGGGSSTTTKPPTTEDAELHKAYLKGYTDNTIRPQGSITRGEVAAIFARLKLDQEDINYTSETKYSDINSSDWHVKYIAYVSDNNIMKGYEDGSFRPDDKITRAEFTTVVSRYNSLSKLDSNFKDTKGHWAEGYIGSVTNKGWVNGYPDGSFKPEKDITREEVATMVNKMLDRKVDSIGIGSLPIKEFKDLNRESWSYYDIVEASNSHEYVRRTVGDIVEDWKNLK